MSPTVPHDVIYYVVITAECYNNTHTNPITSPMANAITETQANARQ